jgi:hypothetical protein
LTATPNDCGSLAPVSDIVSVGACSVTITHKGFDYSDRDKASDNGAVRYKNNGQLTSVDRQIEFDDAPGGGCDMDMKFTNVWDAGGMNPSTLRINTINVDEGASHYLLHGYSLQTSNCKFDKKFKIVSLPWSPDLPFINIVSSDSSLGTASFYDYCSAGSMTNIDCTLPSNTQYIKILQGGDKGSSQSLVIDFPVYECLPSENTNTAGSNAFCASKNATKPYCDTNTKKCYGCSITNNEPSGVNAKPNLNDCGTSSDGVTIGRCALVSGASVGGTCAYETTCNVNPDCSTSCCSKESSPGPSNNPGICITPVSASNPINPYLCKNG